MNDTLRADEVQLVAALATATPSAGAECRSEPRFADVDGDGCESYDGDTCGEAAAASQNVDGVSANDVCCVCGGGVTPVDVIPPAHEQPPKLSPSTPRLEQCDFDRRASLTPQQFASEYASKSRPVIFKASGAWRQALLAQWSAERFRASFGDNAVLALRSGDVSLYRAKDSYLRKEFEDSIQGESSFDASIQGGRVKIVKLSHIVDSLLRDGGLDGGGEEADIGYQFDKASQIAGLLGDLDLSPAASDDAGPSPAFFANFSFGEAERRRKALFGLGGKRSGAYWHTHSAAFNWNALGLKQWMLMPPESSWGADLMSPMQWMRSEAGLGAPGQQRPLQCLQGPDEIMFIPQAWAHMTINVRTSLALAVEVGVYEM